MQTITVSPKFQVVIPREIRKALGLREKKGKKGVRHDLIHNHLF